MTPSPSRRPNWGLIGSVVFVAAALIWLPFHVRYLGGDNVPKVRDLGVSEAAAMARNGDAGLVRIDAALDADAQRFPTGFAPHPYALCPEGDPTPMYNLVYLHGRLSRATGCLTTADRPILPGSRLDVTAPAAAANTAAVPAVRRLVRLDVSREEIWVASPPMPATNGVALDRWQAAAPHWGRVARLASVRDLPAYGAVPMAPAGATAATVPTADALVVLTGRERGHLQSTAAPSLVPVRDGAEELWVEVPPRTNVPAGPVEGRLRAHRTRPGDFATAAGIPAGTLVGVLTPVSLGAMAADQQRLATTSLAISLVLLGFGILGIVLEVRRARQPAGAIPLYRADPEPGVGEEPDALPEVPMVSLDEIPAERDTNLFAKGATFKDWITATPANRREFMRKFLVRVVGKADGEDAARLGAFLALTADALVHDAVQGELPEAVADRREAAEAFTHRARAGLKRARQGERIDEWTALAQARYQLTRSPVLAQLAGSRTLVWALKSGCKRLGLAEPDGEETGSGDPA